MKWVTEIEPLIKVMNGLVSPFLAITVAYIAYQQWRTNQRKEEREVRSIKVSIYKRVKALLNHADSTREVRSDLYEEFKQASAEADFIFPVNVREFLDEIDLRAGEWLHNKECLDNAAPNADQNSLAKIESDNEEYIDYIQQAHCELYDLFNPYIGSKNA